MDAKHTPTPWHRNIPPATKYNTIWSGRNTHVLYLNRTGLDESEVEANAEFIIRAVNAHDALVSALAVAIPFLHGDAAMQALAALALVRRQEEPCIQR